MLLLRLLLVSCCLFGLAMAGDYGAKQPTCQPKIETMVITRTHVETSLSPVTSYHHVVNKQTMDVTSVILVPSTLIDSGFTTEVPAMRISTETSFLTRTIYQVQVQTSLATVVATQTSQVGATSVEVTGSVITQTAIVPETSILTVTVADIRTAFSTVTVTRNVNNIITETEVRPFYVTATRQQRIPVPVTATVTDTRINTIEATVTTTTHEFVTLCYEPKITYDH
ncbi:hypothetical protein Pmani_033831 [Petrolisthes manimaculis]|uniref:Uncharacterized protein n=1 Tax=Petrolisthes manimaculis TaxID=1843537 RepID=A0AAE1NNQ3_9EUCA|nr:hypothetical protein Pmani_033831 [Petrolisthes manimaculis]